MAPNKYREHFIMIPEDVAIQSVAKEFQINYGKKQVSVEKPSGGWLSAKEKCKEISKTIITYPNRRIILLIDFDGQRESRFNEIRGEIDPVVVGNVFILVVTLKSRILEMQAPA